MIAQNTTAITTAIMELHLNLNVDIKGCHAKAVLTALPYPYQKNINQIKSQSGVGQIRILNSSKRFSENFSRLDKEIIKKEF